MQVSLAWWNTGLSPNRKKDRATPEDHQAAESMIHVLTVVAPVDVIGLCEVTPNDIARIKERGGLAGYQVHPAWDVAGRSAFDMCVLYRTDRIAVLEKRNVLSAKGERTTRVGHHLVLAILGEDEPLHVFLSHWPSRLNLSQHDPGRELLGTRLRDAVEEVLEASIDAKIVLVGDYNDEPFDTSIAANLMATRDRDLATRKKHLFYNPFWRHLSSFEDDLGRNTTDRGSYFHRSGDVTRWRTFDQMMFSSSLLRSEGLQLIERNTRVLDIPNYTALVKSAQTCFDHLPIIGQLQKRIIEHG